MASKKKSSKSVKKVDTILVLLIAIVVLAVITLGIVLVISLNTPDIIEPDRNPGLVTETSGSYSNYLSTTKEDISFKELPLVSSENYSSVVLGSDDLVYLVSKGENTDEIPGATGTITHGIKYANEQVSGVVDIFGVEHDGTYSVFALTDSGKLLLLDLNNTDVTSSITSDYSCGREIVGVDSVNGELIAKLYDNSTSKIMDQC